MNSLYLLLSNLRPKLVDNNTTFRLKRSSEAGHTIKPAMPATLWHSLSSAFYLPDSSAISTRSFASHAKSTFALCGYLKREMRLVAEEKLGDLYCES